MIHVIFFIIAFLLLKKKSFRFFSSISPYALFLFCIYVGMILFRFPLLYPSHDDMTLHLMAGDYGSNIWANPHFMPMNLTTYFYPTAEMNYTPFLYLIGIRMTILLNYLILSVWMISLYTRFHSIAKHDIPKLLLKLLFLVFPFIPPLMSTHGSLMTDYFSLVLIAESFFQFMGKNKDKTFGVFILIAALLVKQSTAFFVLSVFTYYFFHYRKAIRWKIIFAFSVIVSFYFIRLWMVTGNPLFGLFNGFFKSPLYEIANFKDVRWGPNSIIETVVWPIIGQFTKRFDETVVPIYTGIFFSPFFILAYIVPLTMLFIKKKIHYLFYFLCVFLWGYMSGYSRYAVPLVFISLILIILETNFQNSTFITSRIYQLFCILVALGIVFSSLKVDLAFRPYPSLKTSQNNQSYLQEYMKGLDFSFKDTVSLIARQTKNDFKGYDAVVPVYRGISTFYAYVGSLNGLPVIQGISKKQYGRIISDKGINAGLKNKIIAIKSYRKILVAAEKTYENQIPELFISDFFTCKESKPASSVSYLQGGYFDEKLLLFSCDKKSE